MQSGEYFDLLNRRTHPVSPRFRRAGVVVWKGQRLSVTNKIRFRLGFRNVGDLPGNKVYLIRQKSPDFFNFMDERFIKGFGKSGLNCGTFFAAQLFYAQIRLELQLKRATTRAAVGGGFISRQTSYGFVCRRQQLFGAKPATAAKPGQKQSLVEDIKQNLFSQRRQQRRPRAKNVCDRRLAGASAQ